MMWRQWHFLFRARADRPLPQLPTQIEVPRSWRAPLARSLARFQLGEGGEGRIANEIRRVQIDEIDDDYRAALRLFVREEGRHARILANMVRGLGGQLCRQDWSERAFVRARRLAGVRLKILVLLAAEVVGIGFYGSVAAALPEGPLRAALEQISADEEDHLRFHVDFFRRWLGHSSSRRVLFAAAWPAIAYLACGLVVIDHRRTFEIIGIGKKRALLDYSSRIRAVLRQTLMTDSNARQSPAHTPQDSKRKTNVGPIFSEIA
ncbi:MAG TPA: ferritin-like domain-containing protein [Nannocystis exedens]|nr:ferritin-like domain-containing protein [Nannocystis exedens]